MINKWKLEKSTVKKNNSHRKIKHRQYLGGIKTYAPSKEIVRDRKIK